MPAANSFAEKDLSPTGHDAKEQTRQYALDVVQESTVLWDHEQQCLSCGWLELAGAGAPTLDLLLKKKALTRGHFYGVDTDPSVIEGARAKYEPHGAPATWIEGDILPKLRMTSKFQDVGVLVYDSFDSLRGNTTIRENLPVLVRFAVRQQERLGDFLLVLNVVAAPRHVSEGDKEAYRGMLFEEVGVEVPKAALFEYQSRKTPMLWTALRFGF